LDEFRLYEGSNTMVTYLKKCILSVDWWMQKYCSIDIVLVLLYLVWETVSLCNFLAWTPGASYTWYSYEDSVQGLEWKSVQTKTKEIIITLLYVLNVHGWWELTSRCPSGCWHRVGAHWGAFLISILCLVFLPKIYVLSTIL